MFTSGSASFPPAYDSAMAILSSVTTWGSNAMPTRANASLNRPSSTLISSLPGHRSHSKRAGVCNSPLLGARNITRWVVIGTTGFVLILTGSIVFPVLFVASAVILPTVTARLQRASQTKDKPSSSSSTSVDFLASVFSLLAVWVLWQTVSSSLTSSASADRTESGTTTVTQHCLPQRASNRRAVHRSPRAVLPCIPPVFRQPHTCTPLVRKRSFVPDPRHGRDSVLRPTSSARSTRRVHCHPSSSRWSIRQWSSGSAPLRSLFRKRREHVHRLLVRHEPASAVLAPASADNTAHTDI